VCVCVRVCVCALYDRVSAGDFSMPPSATTCAYVCRGVGEWRGDRVKRERAKDRERERERVCVCALYDQVSAGDFSMPSSATTCACVCACVCVIECV